MNELRCLVKLEKVTDTKKMLSYLMKLDIFLKLENYGSLGFGVELRE